MFIVKRLSYWILSAAVIVGIGAGVFYLSSPPPAAAAPCIPGPCPSGTPNSTATVWGLGNSCSEARTSASTQAFILAANGCSRVILVCNFSLVEHGSGCFYNNSKQKFQVDAHGIYNCADCQGF